MMTLIVENVQTIRIHLWSSNFSSIPTSPSHTPHTFWKNHLLRFFGASALHKAINTLPKKGAGGLRSISTAIPGLSCQPGDKKFLASLLENELKRKSNLVLWPDILNKSIIDHPHRHSLAETFPQLLETLRQHKQKFAAIIQKTEQRDPENLRAIHVIQSGKILELNKIRLMVRKSND